MKTAIIFLGFIAWNSYGYATIVKLPPKEEIMQKIACMYPLYNTKGIAAIAERFANQEMDATVLCLALDSKLRGLAITKKTHVHCALILRALFPTDEHIVRRIMYTVYQQKGVDVVSAVYRDYVVEACDTYLNRNK